MKVGPLLPEGATEAAGLLLRTRGVRAFVDGLVAVVLPSYLVVIGFTNGQVGAIVTATLLGSAALTLGIGMGAHRYERRTLMRFAAVTMVLTGLGFFFVTEFWLLLPFAVLGTLNPSAGDVSVFLPTEQSLLPATAPDTQRTALYARYNLVAYVVAAFGSLAAGAPVALGRRLGISDRWALGSVFLLYAVVGLLVLHWYREIPDELAEGEVGAATPLRESRAVVYRLAATFSVDALGGGFVVQSMLVLWLQVRFGLSVGVTGAIFFWTGLLAGSSALVAPHLAKRVGLVRTMVFTHLPANMLLIATAFMPTAPLAVACLLARSALAQMDVPAGQSYVMAVVTPGERAAAASVTNVPRSLASALPPLAAGWMLERSTFGWPLIIGGFLKASSTSSCCGSSTTSAHRKSDEDQEREAACAIVAEARSSPWFPLLPRCARRAARATSRCARLRRASPRRTRASARGARRPLPRGGGPRPAAPRRRPIPRWREQPRSPRPAAARQHRRAAGAAVDRRAGRLPRSPLTASRT